MSTAARRETAGHARCRVLSMKEGRVSSGGARWWPPWWWWGRVAHLSIAPVVAGDQVGGSRSGSAFQFGAVRRPGRAWRLPERRVGCGEHVPDRLGESAGDVDRGDLGAAWSAEPVLGALVAVAVGGVAAARRGRLRSAPSAGSGGRSWQRAAPVAFAGLVDARAQPGVADQFRRRREAADLADLGGDRVGEDPADAGRGHQQRHVAVVGAERAQLALAGVDLVVERVDQSERGVRRSTPTARAAQPLEQLAAAGAEQVACPRSGCRAEAVAWIRFFSAVRCLTRWSRNRARSRSARTAGSGSQISGTRSRRRELGQHPGSRSGRSCRPTARSPRLARIGDPHIPAGLLELVVDETGPVIDSITASTGAGAHRRPADKPGQPVPIRRHRARPRHVRRPRRAPASRDACG